MNIQEDVDLSLHSTMRLGGKARYVADVTSRKDIEDAIDWAIDHKVALLMIGGGSNILWRDEGFDGLLLINKMRGYTDHAEDVQNHYITIGAGENWDSVVSRSVADGLTGIEALSSIPGSSGATPIQNVGAYGQDISQTLVSIEAYDTDTRQFVTIPASDCGFGYRTSRFKTSDRERFFIATITLHLRKQNPTAPYYRAVEDYLHSHPVQTVTPQVIRNAVVAIRSAKLPDPATVANNGSFFANPVVSKEVAGAIGVHYPDVPSWPEADGRIKIPAAWLIEKAGFKDYHDKVTGMATWATQPLVLVNEHATSLADLLTFKKQIVETVQKKFDIVLEQEPELLP